MSRLVITITLGSLLLISAVSSKKLESVPESEFAKLIKTEKYVVALFSKSVCQLIISITE